MQKIVRYILFTAIASLMAACSAEDEPLRGRPLTFTATEDMPSRGTAFGNGWSTQDGSAFNVVAHYYAPATATPQTMMDNIVTYSNSVWGYSPVVYWPLDGTADFFSFAPACEGARKEFQRFTPSHTDQQAILATCHVPASQITTIKSLGAITAYPHDAADQYDLMMAYERNMVCAKQLVTSYVNMRFVHVMAGIKIDMTKLAAKAKTKIPENTSKIVIGIGRIRTGGTLAICEPATPGAFPEVVWSLDGQEGTFYETYEVKWDTSVSTGEVTISRHKPDETPDTNWQTDDTFFFPPQKFESGLTVTAYFYKSDGKRIDYRTLTLPTNGDGAISALERGKIINLSIQ